MYHTSLIPGIVSALVTAFFLGMITSQICISPIVGYMLAGMLIGPFTPGFIADMHLASDLAEIGIIFLMFGVGLHFSLVDLMKVKRIAIPGAIAQIIVSTFLGLIFSWLMSWFWVKGLVFGLCLSTASTVVLLRSLEERNLIETRRGQIAIGWLLVEDLVMVLTLVLLPAISGVLNQEETNIYTLIENLIVASSKVITFVTLMLMLGRRIIPWVLSRAATTGSRELFTLGVVTLALGISFAAVEFFNLSFALGSFLAGMVLSESRLSQQAMKSSVSLKDIFSVLFFVFIGMLFDPTTIITQPFSVFGTLIIVVFGKSIAAWLIVSMFKNSERTALTISVSLAQIGEFSFILAGISTPLGLMNESSRNLVLASAILSIMLNPLLFTFLEKYLKNKVS